MNSRPARSAICARRTQSGQLPDHRSGTVVTARPEEQLAPNRPSLSRLALPIAARLPFLTSRSKVTRARSERLAWLAQASLLDERHDVGDPLEHLVVVIDPGQDDPVEPGLRQRNQL